MSPRLPTLVALLLLCGCSKDPTTLPGDDARGRTTPPTFVARMGGATQGTGYIAGMAVAPDGSVYTSDSGHGSLVHYARGGQWLGRWSPPHFTGMLNGPAPGPVAIAPDGIVYLMDRRQKVITRFDPRTLEFTLVGEVGAVSAGSATPGTLTVDATGRLFVLDFARRRVGVLDDQGRLLVEWGRRCADSCGFERPTAIAVAPDGSIAVADAQLNRISFFTPEGLFLRAWGAPGEAPGRLNGPSALAFDPEGNVVLIDNSWSSRVQVFTPTGGYLRGWDLAKRVEQVSRTIYSTLVAVTPEGETLVVDTYPPGIRRYDAAGRFLTLFGYESDEGVGEFDYWPHRLVLDRADNLYVLDIYAGRIQQFGPDGLFRRDWRTHDPYGGTTRPQFIDLAVDRHGTLFVPDRQVEGVVRYPGGGPEPDTLRLFDRSGRVVVARTIAAGPDDRLFVIEEGGGRVLRYTNQGVLELEWMAAPDDSGRAVALYLLVADPLGRLWTTAWSGERGEMRVYDAEGARVGGFPLPGRGVERITAPRGLCFLPSGDVCIADALGGTGRLVLLSPTGHYLTRWYLAGSEGRVLFPLDVALDSHGQLYVADLDNGPLWKFAF